MRVELDNGMRFVANFRYSIIDRISEDPVKDGADRFRSIKASSYASFDSQCNKTMVGFVQTIGGEGTLQNHKVQCFVGKQTKHYDIQHSKEDTSLDGTRIAYIEKVSSLAEQTKQSESDAKEAKTEKTETADAPADDANVMIKETTQVNTFLREGNKRKSHSRYNAHHAHVASDENDLLIDTINSLDLGWKADTCKYQKHHEKYGSHCDKPQTTSLAQTGNSETQASKGKEEVEVEAPFGKQKNFESAWNTARKFQKYSNAD